MNWVLLYSISTLALLLFLHDAWLFRRVSAMTKTQQNCIFGGLGRSGIVFQTWCVSFALSSVGLCCSFYVHVSFSTGALVVWIFAAFHAALIVYNIALLQKDTVSVFVCLSVVLLCYVYLFAYTLYLFPVDDPFIDNAALLYTTHICNFICILHAFVLDFCIWQMGWWTCIDQPESDAESDALLVEH
jgi:hypothetical protein